MTTKRSVGSEVLVGDVPARYPVCVDRSATILAASNLMRIYQVEDLLVTHQRDGRLVPEGILSACDIVTLIIATELDPAVLTVGDMMWSGPTARE